MVEKEVGHLHTLRSKLRSFDVRDDRGDLAVIMGIFVLMLLTMIPLAGYVGALAQQPIVLQDQKYQGALGAAESGVSDFMNRLNAALSYATASQVNPSGFVASPGGGYFYYTTSQCPTAQSPLLLQALSPARTAPSSGLSGSPPRRRIRSPNTCFSPTTTRCRTAPRTITRVSHLHAMFHQVWGA